MCLGTHLQVVQDDWSREVGWAEEGEFGFTLKAMGATRGL